VLSLQSLPSAARPSAPELRVNAHGFSLHAAVRWRADQRKELEHLCRYITRPAIANERLKRNRANHISWSRFTLLQLCQNYMTLRVRIGKMGLRKPPLNG
jgi:Putative transposase